MNNGSASVQLFLDIVTIMVALVISGKLERYLIKLPNKTKWIYSVSILAATIILAVVLYKFASGCEIIDGITKITPLIVGIFAIIAGVRKGES